MGLRGVSWGRRHSRERELRCRGVGVGKEHGVSPEPLGRGCLLGGCSLEMGAGEVGRNQMTRASKATARHLCFLQLVLGEKSLKVGTERMKFVFS